MGAGSWTSNDWSAYSTRATVGKTQAQIFTKSAIDPSLSASTFTNGIRESVDSVDNPNSTPVCIFSDVTGSMGITAETVIRKLDVVCQELLDRKPISDVHLLTGAIGDAYTDRAPFQATQFEADIRIAEQTQKLFLERCGGGNGGESYALAWLFAAMQTATDSFDKRGKKGYLFTIGDEGVHGVFAKAGVTRDQAKRFLNLDIERDLTALECLQMAQRKWIVYHIVVHPNGQHRRDVDRSFGVIMPDNLIYLESVDMLPETIVSTIQVVEGANVAQVAQSWGDGKTLVLAKALNGITTQNGGNSGIVKL